MKSKKVKIISISLAALLLLGIGGYLGIRVYGDFRVDKDAGRTDKQLSIASAQDRGEAALRAFNTGRDVVVAYVGGQPVYQNDAQISKLKKDLAYQYNQAYGDKKTRPKTDAECIRDAAKYKLAEILLRENDIVITKEEMIKDMLEFNQKSRETVAAGGDTDGEIKKRLEMDVEFAKGMGMTEEEYINGVGSDWQLDAKRLGAAVPIISAEDNKKLVENPNYKAKSLEELWDEWLEKYDFKIVKSKLE